MQIWLILFVCRVILNKVAIYYGFIFSFYFSLKTAEVLKYVESLQCVRKRSDDGKQREPLQKKNEKNF